MGAPSGGLAKLYIIRETTPGQPIAYTGITGLRLYFDSFQVRRPVRTERIAEIRGSNTYDEAALYAGPSEISGTISFPLRYSPVHACLLGWAAGLLTSTGGTPNQHVVTTDDRLESCQLTHVFPYGTDAVQLYAQNQFQGCKPTKLTLSGKTSGAVMASIDFVAQQGVYSETEITSPNVPPDSAAGFSPYPGPLVLWNHAIPGSCEIFFSGGGAATDMKATEWEISIENPVEQTVAIGNSLIQSIPSRSAPRNVTGRITLEQDIVWTEQVLKWGWSVTNPASIVWAYDDPDSSSTTNKAWTFDISNAYLTEPGGGTDSMGPQRQTISYKAIYKAGGTTLNPEPFRAVNTDPLLEPTGYLGGTGYDDILHP